MDTPIEEQNKWVSTWVKCDLCGREWVAVYNIDCEKLECPTCRNMAHYEIMYKE